MRNSLTKTTVRQVPTLELAMRFNHLLQIAETTPAHVLTMADAREVLWVEDELRRRLLTAIGHDFYPPEVPAKTTMAELRTGSKRMLQDIPKAIPTPTSVVQPAAKEEGKLRFKVAIINSLGSTVTTLNLRVDDKSKAAAAALKTITQLGLKKATFKIG